MIAKRFTESYEIYRPVPTKDAGGAVENTYTLSSTISGYMESLSGSERIQEDRLQATSTHRLFCAVNIDIQEPDEIRVGSARYRVQYVQRHTLGVNAHSEVVLSKVE